MQFLSFVMIIFLTNTLFWHLVMQKQIEEDSSMKSISKSCLERKSSGLCRGKLLRYAYDKKSNNCISFYYSGCGATQNNFITYEECRLECIPQFTY